VKIHKHFGELKINSKVRKSQKKVHTAGTWLDKRDLDS